MNILCIRTDSEDAYLALSLNGVPHEYTWRADRQLSDTILVKIKDLLEKQNLSWKAINGVAVYEGPGSFTGLRIGITVANTLAYGLKVPVVGTRTENWTSDAIQKLKNGDNHKIVKPFYGRDARITTPRK